MVTTLSLAQRASKLKLWSANIPAMEMFKMLLWRRSQIKIDFEIYEVVGDNNRRVARQRDVDAVPMPPPPCATPIRSLLQLRTFEIHTARKQWPRKLGPI